MRRDPSSQAIICAEGSRGSRCRGWAITGLKEAGRGKAPTRRWQRLCCVGGDECGVTCQSSFMTDGGRRFLIQMDVGSLLQIFPFLFPLELISYICFSKHSRCGTEDWVPGGSLRGGENISVPGCLLRCGW